MRRMVAAACLGAFFLSGCYTYSPIAVGDLQPDMEVRAEVTPAERDALAEVLPGEDRTLDGTVVSTDGSQLMLQVEAVAAQRGIRMETLDQRIQVDKAAILEVQVREQDSARTAGLVAAITAGVIALLIVALDQGGAKDPTNPNPDPPQDAIVPTGFRIPIGF